MSESPARLDGRRVAVTRGKGGEDPLTARLRELGAHVLEVPAIAIAPPESWDEFDAALHDLEQYDWIAFASATAVDAALSRIVALGLPPPPVGTRLAAVGRATARRLQERLRAPDLVPENATGAALAEAMAPQVRGRRVLVPRAAEGRPELQEQGGLAPLGVTLGAAGAGGAAELNRINMLTAIRRTLDVELTLNPRMVVFGEDVGPKGGVHGATLGLQDKHGAARVFDTSLSEEGIIGRAVGMALAGLLPVPEIQFRKYADPATEQLNDCGTLRWRTANRFAAPLVVRMPGGYFKCGDPWHSQTNEVAWAHGIGWRLAVPSNAEDAVGLLRAALRGNDPTIFFEHRALLDGAWARRPYPGDRYVLPFGVARRVREGSELTIVTWGAMVERCELAAEACGVLVEILDLRTLSPWDREAVLASVRKTHRCLIVHEDNLTAGFGAEVAAVLAREAFFSLEAPVERLAMPDIPSPHAPVLLEAAVPGVESITRAIRAVASV